MIPTFVYLYDTYMFMELYNVCQNGVRLLVRNVAFSSFSAILWLPGEKTRTDQWIPQQLVDLVEYVTFELKIEPLANICGDRFVIRSKWSEPVGHLDCICSAIWTYAKHPCLWINISGFKFVVETIYYISVWCFVDCYLSFCPFSFGHCTVCPSSIYGFCFASFGIFFDFFFTIDRFVFWKYH
jgi:hypothetical protein